MLTLRAGRREAKALKAESNAPADVAARAVHVADVARCRAAKAATARSANARVSKKPSRFQVKNAAAKVGHSWPHIGVADMDGYKSFDLTSPHMQAFEALAMEFGGGTNNSGEFATAAQVGGLGRCNP